MNMELWKMMLVLASAALAGSHAKPTIDMSSRLRYCGTRLSTVLGVLCTNFNQPAWDTDEEQGNRVIRSTQEGVVDECCRTSCTWNHLASYCSKGTVNEETILNHPLLRELFESQSTHIMSDRSAEAFNDSDNTSEMQYDAAERSVPVLGTVAPARTRARLVAAPWSPAIDTLFLNYHQK